MKSAPCYFKYIKQDTCPFFEKRWKEKLVNLMLDLSWIDELEATDNEIYSRDFSSDNFPTFWNWPQHWQSQHNDVLVAVHDDIQAYLTNATVYEINNDRLYILDDDEEVWFSTTSYANGEISKMVAVSSPEVEFDSAITAAYAFKNEFQDWENTHGAAYRAADILSNAERQFTDSLVGTTQECDKCAAYTKIVQDNGNIVLCNNCAN